MQTLPFNQTRAEFMVRIAASIVVNGLRSQGARLEPLGALAADPQYGFSAPARTDGIGDARLVRITDLKDGSIAWDRVPFCDCKSPALYLLRRNDILFARTGEGATGKTHLVGDVPEDVPAIFASYLIRVRPTNGATPGFIYCFLQSDDYWAQITEQRRGSAQPNVNAKRLKSLLVPVTSEPEQRAIEELLRCVRQRQDGSVAPLPRVPASLDGTRNRIELAEAILSRAWAAQDASRSRRASGALLVEKYLRDWYDDAISRYPLVPLGEVLTRSQEMTTVVGSETYRQITVKLWGRGVVLRNEVPGTEIGAGRRFLARAQHFIFSRIDARHGAFGVVPPLLDGAVVSGDFPVFAVDGNHAIPEYIGWLARCPQFVELCARASSGSTNRVRLKEERLLASRVPLPLPSAQGALVRQLAATCSRLEAVVETLEAEESGRGCADCAYRSKPIAHSAASRSPVPVHADHLFRSKPIAERVGRWDVREDVLRSR